MMIEDLNIDHEWMCPLLDPIPLGEHIQVVYRDSDGILRMCACVYSKNCENTYIHALSLLSGFMPDEIEYWRPLVIDRFDIDETNLR